MPGQGQGGLCRRCNRPTSEHKHKQARRSQEHKLQRGTQYNSAHNQYKAHNVFKNTAHYTNEHKLKRSTAAHTKTQHTTSLYVASNIK